ncbi:hypothetical protein C2G38_2062738 [Gigaspora rosea]|uniref:Serine-threonine/tyrosine-protein kinase catalytic domain-containing protein n=1 Tax=Gigaspora rosea TaxID=44941 RepID=A0A397VZB7_9GLOM|nr:hypothetical protein C2G38_2062738 [Gigaspora rosea]
MWEILYGISVPYNQEFGKRIQIEICSNDLRPTIFGNKTQCYIILMKKCWEKDPVYRPSATNICEILTEWINDENILSKFISYTTSLTDTSVYQDSGLNNLNIDEKI